MHRADGEALAHARVTASAGLAEVLGMDGGARIAGGQDVVDAMTGGAVRNRLGSAAGGEPVEAVLEARQLVRGHVVAGREAFILMAVPAGHGGDPRGIHQGAGLGGRQEIVLPVAARAVRRALGAGLHRHAVHALGIHLQHV